MDVFNNKPPKKGKKNRKRKKVNGKVQFFSNLVSTILIFMIIASLYSFFTEGREKIGEVTISQLATDIKSELVSDISVEGDKLKVVYSTADEDGVVEKKSKKEVGGTLSETLTNYGVTAEELSNVNIEIKSPSGLGFWLLNLAPFLLPVLFIIFLIWLVSKQVKGSGGMQAFTFGKSKARMIDPSNKNERVTFKDVAGAKEAKEELVEIVDFLKNPKKFLDIGARIPKGVLLMGAPGTGKTLLARAVAGEAKVPFFIISGSEFVEMFVGVGASRVRDLFNIAKKEAPAIIFVDEIDAVGRVRGGGVGGGSDEREQTLNQILVEMDGFEPHEKVIVMAATNRPDVLDPALLRPGRFDRRVMLDLPDRNDREEILKIHSRGKTFGEDVALRTIAERTPGFSGADLFSLMNESAILAAREERKQILQFDLIRSVEKVMLGPERKSHVLSKKEKRLTAYHEAGHALVASMLSYSDPVHKVSVIARGRAGGYMLKLPIEERRMQSKKEFLDDIAVSLGGYATERIVFDDLTTGPSSDLQVSTALAMDMVTKYGMSDKIGPTALESSSGSVLMGQDAVKGAHSEEMSKMIDAEVARIIDEALTRANNIIIENKKALDSIANKLIEVETLEKEDFEKLLILNGIEPKKKHGSEIAG